MYDRSTNSNVYSDWYHQYHDPNPYQKNSEIRTRERTSLSSISNQSSSLPMRPIQVQAHEITLLIFMHTNKAKKAIRAYSN